MKNYNNNYLKIVSKMYCPSKRSEKLRFIKGGTYMLTKDTKYNIIKETGSDSAAILYEYFYEYRNYNHFAPTNDERIARELGWSASKVARIKSLLKKHKYLLILKDTVKDGTVLYRTILDPVLIRFYEENNKLPEDIDIAIKSISKNIEGEDND
jgi:hypothetical protein